MSGKSIDGGLYAIKNRVNSFFGTSDTTKTDEGGETFSTKHMRNNLMFMLAFKEVFLNLPPGCQVLKQTLGQELQKYCMSPDKDFTTQCQAISAPMERKGWSTEFTTIKLPQTTKKDLNINNVDKNLKTGDNSPNEKKC